MHFDKIYSFRFDKIFAQFRWNLIGFGGICSNVTKIQNFVKFERFFRMLSFFPKKKSEKLKKCLSRCLENFWKIPKDVCGSFRRAIHRKPPIGDFGQNPSKMSRVSNTFRIHSESPQTKFRWTSDDFELCAIIYPIWTYSCQVWNLKKWHFNLKMEIIRIFWFLTRFSPGLIFYRYF